MTELLEPHAIGEDLARRDGERKVRGTATYAYETPVDRPAYAFIVQAAVARGRVTAVDTAAAEGLAGVLAVLTADNAERLAGTDDRELAVLQSAEVAFRGQPVGLVVAETSETARQAAELVRMTYAEQPHDTELRPDSGDLYKPEKVNPSFETDTDEGDVAAAMASAAVTLDRTYTTAMYHNNPLEPHATTALWEPGADVPLTLWDSTQGVHPARSAVAKALGLDEQQIRVVCPFVGGGFGSKGNPHANVILAALAARALPGRPVKLALTRQQMFFLAGYRTPTIQRLQLAADASGRLTAIAIDVVEQTSRIKEFAEQTGVATRMMYAAPSRRTTHRLAALDVPVPSWMRAPGEAPGMFGPEVALDELAGQLGIDPVELRIRNEPAVDPETGKPWSSRHLVECLRAGARRFGWHDRDPRPGVRREGDVADRHRRRLLGVPDHADAAVGRDDPVLRRPLHRRDRRSRPRHRRLDGAAPNRRRRPRCPSRRRRRADRRYPLSHGVSRRRLVRHQHLGIGHRGRRPRLPAQVRCPPRSRRRDHR